MLNRYVVVSTNNNPDYIFYAPYIEKAWAKLGWGLVIMVTSDVKIEDLKITIPGTVIRVLRDIEGVRKESIAQAGRLYVPPFFTDDTLLMTSDIDLLPLSDYWNPNPNEITVYGHDLTDYTYFPMGYTAMKASKWRELFNDIQKDAEEYAHITKAPDWETWWNWDWRMLTDRLKKEQVTHKHRGRRLTGTYAYGRIDRGDSMQIPPNETLIDAHCENVNVMHPDKLNKFLSIFETHYGKL